jgi:hypothetical protein
MDKLRAWSWLSSTTKTHIGFCFVAVDMSVCFLLDANELLAEVVALKESHEGTRCIFETFGDGFMPNHFAGLDKRCHVLDKLVLCIEMVPNDEALHPNASWLKFGDLVQPDPRR